MNFVEELKWRGMVHDIMPGTEELLRKEKISAYVGIDPTADSLHIGHLVSIMLLKHLQLFGHTPLVVVGGATGMIGDPSFKSEERKLLTLDDIEHNLQGIQKQLSAFLDFDFKENKAEILNNYDWTKDYSFLDFIRDIGKHLSVNYMMAKDSVKNAWKQEYLLRNFLINYYKDMIFFIYINIKIAAYKWEFRSMGKYYYSTELIRRVCGGEAYALTCPLITKSDGGKFGKTENGNIG
jgi:tyrosyl-tRNA synthetase